MDKAKELPLEVGKKDGQERPLSQGEIFALAKGLDIGSLVPVYWGGDREDKRSALIEEFGPGWGTTLTKWQKGFGVTDEKLNEGAKIIVGIPESSPLDKEAKRAIRFGDICWEDLARREEDNQE